MFPIKKLISLLLAFSLVFALCAMPSGAAGEVFVATGNTVLPLNYAPPIRSSGVWYIDYQCLTSGELNVSSSYNSTERILVLYTWDTTLIFDLNETTAYTTAEKVKYKAVAFASSGTVYVPVQFTAQMLGFEYTFLSDISMIRIKRPSDIPNDIFLYIAEEAAQEVLERYNAEKENETPSQSNSKPSTDNKDTPTQSTEKRYIALTFNITDGKNLPSILDVLSRYGYKATFFVMGSAIENCEDALRRAVASGHKIGTLSQNGEKDFSGSVDELSQSLRQCNNLLFDVTKTKTRLVRVPGGSANIPAENADALISLGYRIWDQSILPTGTGSSQIYNFVVSRLSSGPNSSVLTLSDTNNSVSALTRLLRYFNSNKFSVYAIDLLDTPVNALGKRG